MTFSENKIAAFNQLLAKSNSIVITSHKSPDGDSIGSSLALYHYLMQEKIKVKICHPDPAPHFLHWMKGQAEILTLEENETAVKQLMEQADLIFCLDYNAAGRIGKLDDLLASSTAPRIMIDHHRDPDHNFAQLMFSDTSACSTAQLIFELIESRANMDQINHEVAEAIYTGIITDTGSFRFSSVLPKTHEIAAFLLRTGIDHAAIHENIFDTNTEDRIKLTSYALLEKLVVLKDYQTAFISLTKAEQERFSAIKGDTEGLVNQALSVQGVKMALFFKESDGIIKISFRSTGKIPVNDMARNNFQGGGHLNASGGKFVGKIEDAIAKFVTILPNFVEENKACFK